MTSRALKSVPSYCDLRTPMLYYVVSPRKRQWSRMGENVFASRVIIGSGAMIAPFLSDSSVRTSKYCRLLFLYASSFLKEMAVQGIDNYAISEMFLQRMDQAIVLVQFRSVVKYVQHSANFYLMRLGLETITPDSYFSCHMDINFFILDICHIPKFKSDKRINN